MNRDRSWACLHNISIDGWHFKGLFRLATHPQNNAVQYMLRIVPEYVTDHMEYLSYELVMANNSTERSAFIIIIIAACL